MKSLVMLAVALLLVGLAGPANAQTGGFEVSVTVRAHSGVVSGSAGDTFLSFSGPIEIPGIGLSPGTYIFRLVSPSVMQVVSENRKQIYGMFFVTPTVRPQTTPDYSVTLRLIRGDAPPRVETIFPPDSHTGYELPYEPTILRTGLLVMR